jgi:hypothetical protein
LLIGLFPPVFALLGTIWKDVAFAASMLLAFALLLHAELAQSKTAWIFSLVAALYALAVRHNSLPALVPVILYGSWIYLRLFHGHSSWRSVLAVTALILVGLFATVTVINRRLIEGRQMHIEQTIMLHDLAAISIDQGVILLPEWVRGDRSTPTVAQLRTMYHPLGLVSLFCGAPGVNLEQTTNPKELEDLRRVWRSAVSRHLGAYARHRWKVFAGILAIDYICYPYHDGISENSLGIHFHATKINRLVMSGISKVGNSLLFRPWFYLGTLALMLGVFLHWPIALRVPALMLGSSALLYEVAYLFVAPTCDFRYSWYVVLVALVMPLLLLRALSPKTGGAVEGYP